MANPCILADNRFLEGTPTATDTAVGYDVLNVRDGKSFTSWKGASAGTKYLTVDCGTNGAVKNCLLYSEQLNSAPWSGAGIKAFGSGSIANAVAAPDGTTTAELLTEDTTNNNHGVWQSFNKRELEEVYVLSAYMKKKDRRYTVLGVALPSGAITAHFDLDQAKLNFTYDPGGVVLDSGVEDAGGGWLRLWIAFCSDAGNTINILVGNCDDSGTTGYYVGNGSSGSYAWGVMLSRSHELTTYVQTAGVNTTGFVCDTLAIFKHNLGTAAAAVSVESSLDGAGWTVRLAAFHPSDDKAIMKTFPAVWAKHWRVKIVTASVAAQLAEVMLGSRTTFPYPPETPFVPAVSKIEAKTNIGKTGQILGSVVRFKPVTIAARWTHLSRTWVDATFRPFWEDYASELKPFLWAWDLDAFPTDVRFVTIDPDSSLETPVSILSLYDRVDLRMIGVNE